MKRRHHTIDNQGRANQRRLAEFLTRHGQLLLPMVELIEQSRMAVDDLIDVLGRASIEAVLGLPARQAAAEPQQGKARTGEVVWHGTQAGRVFLREHKLCVNKPRLRRKGRGANKQVPVPAYEAMQADDTTGERMLEILLKEVSARRYERVIPEMADTVSVSRSTVSQEAAEASEATLRRRLERRFDDVELLVIYLDGMQFGEPCVLAAVGVGLEGRKHVLALRECATENAEAAKDRRETPLRLASESSHRRGGASTLELGTPCIRGPGSSHTPGRRECVPASSPGSWRGSHFPTGPPPEAQG